MSSKNATKKGVKVFPRCSYGTDGTYTCTLKDATILLSMLGVKNLNKFLRSCAYFFKPGDQEQKVRMPFIVRAGTGSTTTCLFTRHCKSLVKASLKKEAEDRLTKKAKEAADNIVLKQECLDRNKAEGLVKKAAAAQPIDLEM